MKDSFEIIVIGVGSMGSSACYHLARQGHKVLGIEQFDITHELGSHTGQSRIIRKAYFENSDYVPLLERAYENWKTLEEETGQQIYFPTGLVYFGPSGHSLIHGVKQSASLYGIELEQCGRDVSAKRFPHFRIPVNFETLFEPKAGFLTPERAIRLYTQQAIKSGAKIHTGEKVVDWKKNGKGILVTTSKAIYHCDKLVITAGAWAGNMIPGYSNKIKVTRQFIAWIKPPDRFNYSLDHFPCWLLADDAAPGCYYGFPALPTDRFEGPAGLKLAHHHPATQTDPDQVTRDITKEDKEDLEFVLGKYFATSSDSLLSYKTCLYANSPDEDFIVDKLPGYEESVVIACGFSGHGFKFASVIGEILSALVTEGATHLPVGFLKAGRFAV